MSEPGIVYAYSYTPADDPESRIVFHIDSHPSVPLGQLCDMVSREAGANAKFYFQRVTSEDYKPAGPLVLIGNEDTLVAMLEEALWASDTGAPE